MANFVAWSVRGSKGRPRKHERGWECVNKKICITNKMFKKWKCLKVKLRLANKLP